ncbi:MAG: metal-dependent hydrolase [Promethearchaeota archaeon]
MDFLTHLLFGALIYLISFKDMDTVYFFYVIFFSILPDLDVFLSPLKNFLKSTYLEHRSASHSFIIGIIISAVIGEFFAIFRQELFLKAWIIGSIFYGIHVSLDLLTTTKIPCFYPISKKEYCFYVEKAGSMFTLILSFVSIIGSMIFFSFSNDIFFFLFLINFLTIFFISYYVFRILIRILINFRLKENQKYFPGILPCFYYLLEKKFEKNKIFLKLEKRSIFQTYRILYANNLILTERELKLFKKAIKSCNESYYFTKWTILPIFKRMDNIFSVKLFFIEPMIHSKAVFIQFDFDLMTEKIIDMEQKFGHIN